MRKNKMKFLSIFKNNGNNKHPILQWSSCKQPKTLSFRTGDDIFKTTNSIYFDPLAIDASSEANLMKSCITNSSLSQSTSGEEEVGERLDELSIERIIRGARSERLFFEHGKDNTRSILKVRVKKEVEVEVEELSMLRGSVVMAMESNDPYLDFKKSMVEMVETHGLRDWESLEELLGWYLKINGKINHGFIIRAFVDLLIKLSFTSSSSSCSGCCYCCSEHDHTFMSASSSFSSSSLSPTPKRA